MYKKNKTGSRATFIKLIICTGIFLFSQHSPCFAQQTPTYTFRHLNQSDGLLNKEVRSVVQDEKGYIWILTLSGLQRYDGSRFVNYPYDLNNTSGIMDTRLLNLYSDKKNNALWITHLNLQQLSLQKNKFIQYNVEEILKDKNFGFEPYTDSHDNTWFAGDFGIILYSKSEKKLYPQVYAAPSLTANASNPFIVCKDKDEILFCTFRNFFLFDKKTKRVYTHDYNPIHHPLLEQLKIGNLAGIMKDSNGDIWISTGSPFFYQYNSTTKKLKQYSLTAISKSKRVNLNQEAVVDVRCFFEDNHQILWIGTENAGLLKYDRNKDSFTSIINQPNNSQGLHYNYVISNIYQDKEENIWLGTDDGINIFNPYRQYFQVIHHEEGNPMSLTKNEINNFIQASNGDIIAGTWGGGITIYDRQWNFKKNIFFSKPFEYNMLWSFVQNDDGNIWVGCQHGYIHIYNPFTGLLNTLQPPEVNNFTIRCMAKDKMGNIYMGLHDGKIATWQKNENKFYSYNDSLQEFPQTYGPVFSIFFDSKQRCWVCTESGVKQFDTEKRIYSAVYVPKKNNPQSISAGTSGGIEELNDSTLVIGTVYGGLNFFNTNSKIFSHLGTSDGLPSSTVYSIKKDAKNNLWLTTDYSLYKFKPQEKKFIRYVMEPGTINSAFKPTGFYPLQDGRWLTATATEMICFHPESGNIQSNSNKKVIITGFSVFDSTLFIDSFITANKPIKLNYKQNFLTIEFSLLNYASLEQTNYYYKLSDVDKDWVAAGTKSFASYTNLAPGDYIFSVRAGEEESSSMITSLAISITPPFWKTGWFISLIVCGILLTTYGFIKWRIKNIRAVEAEKLKVQQLNAERYRNKLELEMITNYFSSSLLDKNKADDALWDVAKNLIGRLGFVDCMIYLWNADKTKMIQKAGYGSKSSAEEINRQHFDVLPGQGVVGYVMQTREPVLIPDTSVDKRYRADEMIRLSEITVPIIYNGELLGIIDSEYPDKNFFTQQHIQVLNTIATLMANKLKSIEADQSLQQTKIEMVGINEKLSAAKLEALQSQLNPHFIFNCLNSIDSLIQNNEKEKATLYLSKFAKLIRSILETSKNNTVSCWKDIETLKLYLELEELRRDKKFSYKINMADEILNGDYNVPPLIIQPFVENAIQHGLLNKKDADRKLVIDISISQNHIHYTICDNGVGRAKAEAYKKLNNPLHQSMGMQITTDRINLFNQNTNGSVTITDLYDEQQQPAGTKVEVTIINQ